MPRVSPPFAMPPGNISSANRGRTRLDELVVARGLASTRAEAARFILAGRIRLANDVADKAGRLVRGDAAITLVAAAPFVSRGGEKLASALQAFGIDVVSRVCLDVGASTGGFTDCLLQAGARRVYTVDVGHGQLHPRVSADARVVVLEGMNARYLEPDRLGEPVTLATIDVSFISLAKVLPAVGRCLAILPGGSATRSLIVALVKPQFEVGRAQIGKGGVVRDPALHAQAVRGVVEAARSLGLEANHRAGHVWRRMKGAGAHGE